MKNKLQLKDARRKTQKFGFKLITKSWKGCNNKYKFLCLKHNEINFVTYASIAKCKSSKCCNLEKQKNRKHLSGKNHPRYNPNLTESQRKGNRCVNRNWKKNIKEIYKHKCQSCGKSNLKPHDCIAHHLYSYSSNQVLATDIENGICVCSKCHILFHQTYGYGNNTKRQFDDFKRKSHG